ncbi:MAG TPA: hypothetical protein VMY41_06720 [Thermohalobaculum sp.]|nr:hypothetical protein [Thermohalobaculum sp.]
MADFCQTATSARNECGFDVVCLYGAHGFGVIQNFISTATHQRTDEYDGSLTDDARTDRGRTRRHRRYMRPDPAPFARRDDR